MVLEPSMGLVRHSSEPKSGLLRRQHTLAASRAAADVLPERRRDARIAVAGTPATVNIDFKNAALLFDLGQAGMCLHAVARPLQPGATVWLRFQLPGLSETIESLGRVRWTDGAAKAGIQFTVTAERVASQLRHWLSKNLSKAAQEFMNAAGGWQPALQMMAELTRLLTGANGATISLVQSGRPTLASAGESLSGRSTIVAPIYQRDQILGHLEICASELGAFDEDDIEGLRVLAALVGEMLEVRAADLHEPARRIAYAAGSVLTSNAGEKAWKAVPTGRKMEQAVPWW
jgi:hypothetical protein